MVNLSGTTARSATSGTARQTRYLGGGIPIRVSALRSKWVVTVTGGQIFGEIVQVLTCITMPKTIPGVGGEGTKVGAHVRHGQRLTNATISGVLALMGGGWLGASGYMIRTVT